MKAYRDISLLHHLFKRVKGMADYHGVSPAEIGAVEFTGTVKLHGTNAGIRIQPGKAPVAQSRIREISVLSDNHGFAFFVSSLPQTLLDEMYAKLNPAGTGELTVFGEWCGGSVQGGVGLAKAPKHFVIFSAHVDDEYVPLNYEFSANEFGVYNVGQIPRYSVTIDFGADDQSGLEQYLSELTEAIEKQCPWSYQIFGIEEGIGEGVVWFRTTEPSNTFWFFKTKGEKHSVRKNKNRTLVAVDAEKVASIQECVDIMLTENRMLQMVEREQLVYDPRNIGKFLQAVCTDCAKEELDVVIDSGLEWKDVAKVIQFRARNWFLAKTQAL